MGVMRQAIRNKGPTRAQTSSVQSVPAPMGGWNTRDSLPAMAPQFAPLMDNFFPDSDGVRLRSGSMRVVTFASEKPQRLAALEAGSISQLVAFSASKIWNASVSPAVTIGTGFSTFDWDVAVFANRLVMVNGLDAEQQWDGTTLQALAFSSGYPLATPGQPQVRFVGCHGHSGRMYYWQPHSQTFYYTTSAGTFQGALGSFDLSTITTAAGSIMAMQSWSIYGGSSSANDLLAIFFTSGEVLIYAGTDPGVNFAFQSRFKLAPLLGRRTAVKFGGDVIMGTIDGYFPLSKAIALGSLTGQISISDAIQPSVKQAAAQAPASPLWRTLLYPFGNIDGKGGMLIFNTPTNIGSLGVQQVNQHVMNTRTGAWCRFMGLNAYDWMIWRNQPYFCTDAGVHLFNTGTADIVGATNTAITGRAMQAFSDLGVPGYDKLIKGVRPMVRTDGPVAVALAVAADFADFAGVPATDPVTSLPGSPWNTSPWNTSAWVAGPSVDKDWADYPAEGEYIAAAIQISTAAQVATWFSTKYLFEPGSPFGN